MRCERNRKRWGKRIDTYVVVRGVCLLMNNCTSFEITNFICGCCSSIPRIKFVVHVAVFACGSPYEKEYEEERKKKRGGKRCQERKH